jgi:hypothetical protein
VRVDPCAPRAAAAALKLPASASSVIEVAPRGAGSLCSAAPGDGRRAACRRALGVSTAQLDLFVDQPRDARVVSSRRRIASSRMQRTSTRAAHVCVIAPQDSRGRGNKRVNAARTTARRSRGKRRGREARLRDRQVQPRPVPCRRCDTRSGSGSSSPTRSCLDWYHVVESSDPSASAYAATRCTNSSLGHRGEAAPAARVLRRADDRALA